MTTFLQSGGSQRARHKTCEKASRELLEQSKRRLANKTRDALDQFEEKLIAEQEAQKALDDLPPEADAARLHRMTQMNASRNAAAEEHREKAMSRSQTEPQIRQGATEDPLHARRPPSPLGFYDYGCISSKPRSHFGQHKSNNGESVRAKHRQTSCGHFFPGAQMKQGPYGSHMVDPILMPPRVWYGPASPSLRWKGDAGDIRPLPSEEMKGARNRMDLPVISAQVRVTKGHGHRAKRTFHCLDRNREESVLEQARFEHGVFEGRWRDPLLDMPHIEERPAEAHDWLAMPPEDMTAAQQEAASLLFRLESVANKSKGKLAQLFVDQVKGAHPGILEAHEFMKGLVKNRVVEDGELTEARVVKIMSTVDPAFDGRISIPVLSRATDNARGVRMAHEQAALQAKLQRQVKLSTSYSEALPVEVIKVEHPAVSLLNFNRSFQKFMGQQKSLLERHGEA